MSCSKFKNVASVPARVFDLGSLGSLLEVNVAEKLIKSKNGQSDHDAPHFVFIVDRSGSMGQYSAAIVNKIIRLALLELGFSGQMSITIITFDSYAESISSTIDGLVRVNASSRGCTEMAGVIPHLLSVFTNLGPTVPIVIVAISDGGISDIAATVAAAQAASVTIGSRVASIRVFLYRLMTGGAPDTRALSCFGALNTAGPVPVVDISTALGVEGTTAIFITQLVADLSGTNTGSVSLSCPLPLLRRMPTDTPLDNISIPHGQISYILLAPGIDPVNLLCAGIPLTIVATRLSNEQEIGGFLQFIESQLRIWAIIGTRQAQIASVIEWIRPIESLLTATTQQVATGSVRLRDRVQHLIASVQKSEGTIISRIRALGNLDKIATLNSAQQADFLRGNVSSVGLAKRAAPVTDLGNLCCSSIRALNAATSAIQELPVCSDEASSFFSLATWKEIFEASIELYGVVNQLTISDVLTILGGLGIAFRASQGDLPDPWNFNVCEVYLGSYLSEADLRAAFIQSGGVPLQFPGTGRDSPINGVVPIRRINPAAYDIYMRITRDIAQMQASASMRQVIACVPYDNLARDAAVLFCLIRQIGYTKQLLEVEHFTVSSLLEQITIVLSTYARTSFADLASDLSREDVRPWLTGDRGIAGILKPVMILLASPDCASVRANPHMVARVLRDLYALEAYHTARRIFRDGGRVEALHALIGIDLEESRRCSNVGELFAEDGAYGGNIPIDFVTASGRASILEWMPSIGTFAAIARFAIAFDPVDISILEANMDILCLGAAVEALNCSCEDDRINKLTRVAKGPLAGDISAIQAYIATISNDFYRADYDRRLATKHTEESRLRLAHLLSQLISCDNLDQFITLIAGISNRSAQGFQELVEGLLNRSIEVPLRLMKIWIVLLGRHPENEETIVWADGNVFNGNYSRFAWAFDELDTTGRLWHQLKNIKLRFGIYVYSRDDTNRHGHSNEHPSYWALGFPTLAEYQEAVSPADYQAYAQAHPNCCGFRTH